ncbi:tumor necrosis factor receptor superfamily member 5-like [Hypanus sabinus]|uniref:tumor necrosis factor receptor superfamily member 5-like n=1 Tax=Hypanus sabinus TaxID=79690 RepID=UPI0028C376D9|nr:tumor necrosis factor receptor superfamily member 5-like [Hypanus sabinus]
MAVLYFLLLLVPVRGGDSCSELEYQGEHRCCKMCPAGSYVAQDCTLTRDTQCRPCGDGEYIETANGQLKCFRCKFCDPVEGRVELSPCTRRSPTICGCAPGFVCEELVKNGTCSSCRRESLCPAGQGVSSPGNETGEAPCKPCSEGTFSSSPSRKPCKPWTRCGTKGLQTLRDGTAVSDAECGSAGPQRTWVLAVVLAWALVFFLLLIIVCLVSRRDTSSTRTKKLYLYQCFQNFIPGQDEVSDNSSKLLKQIV